MLLIMGCWVAAGGIVALALGRVLALPRSPRLERPARVAPKVAVGPDREDRGG